MPNYRTPEGIDFKAPNELRIYWPHDFLKKDPRRHLAFASYVQTMANRLLVGGLQYGPANKIQKYANRAEVGVARV